MSRFLKLLSHTFLIAISGCDEGHRSEAPPESPVAIGASAGAAATEQKGLYYAFSTYDGQTAQADGDPLALICSATPFDGGIDVDPDVEEQLKADVFLRTWPEQDPVEFDFINATAGAFPQHKTWQVNPRAPLEGRWYVLGVSAAFSDRSVAPYPLLPGGDRGVRFRPDSKPRVSRITFCPIGIPYTGEVSVSTSFSETLDIETLNIATGAQRYGDVVTVIPSASCETHQASAFGLVADCLHFPLPSTVTVRVAGGVYSKSGQLLEPGSWTVNLDLPLSGECDEFQPPF